MKALTRTMAETDLLHALDHGDIAEAYRMAEALDLMGPAAPPSMLDAALWYGSLGVAVFPLQPGSKVPYPGSRGSRDAVTDPAAIRAAFTGKAGANVAIATGDVVDVMDVDGLEGATWLARNLLHPEIPNEALEGDGPLPMDLWQHFVDEAWCGIHSLVGVVSTPRAGGRHFYIRAQGRKNTAGMHGMDYRGKGGYVVAPPSTVGGVRYSWVKVLAL